VELFLYGTQWNIKKRERRAEIAAQIKNRRKEKNMNYKKETNFKPLYLTLLMLTFLMIVAMLIFQNKYR